MIVNFPSTFGEDSCGHVYVAGQGSGTNVFRIRQPDPPGQFCIPRYDLPVLTAHVDDDFTIDLKDPNGQSLNGGTLPQGAYTLELDDNSTFHNFHLTGNVGLVRAASELCIGHLGHRARNLDGQLHDRRRPRDVSL